MLEFLSERASQLKTFYVSGMVVWGIGQIVLFYFAYKESLKSAEKAPAEMLRLFDLAWAIAFAWMLLLWPYYALKAIFSIASVKGGEEE